ncbi:TAP46-like protein [Sesbania bispinosa]|nr:TAP46-like protein [Sesbania bispinosa]
MPSTPSRASRARKNMHRVRVPISVAQVLKNESCLSAREVHSSIIGGIQNRYVVVHLWNVVRFCKYVALFEQSQKIHAMTMESVADQELVKRGCEALSKCEDKVNKLGLFSANETNKDIIISTQPTSFVVFIDAC